MARSDYQSNAFFFERASGSGCLRGKGGVRLGGFGGWGGGFWRPRGLPGEEMPLAFFFAPDAEEIEGEVDGFGAFEDGGFGLTGHEGDIGARKGELALGVSPRGVAGFAAGEGGDHGVAGIDEAIGVGVAEIFGEDGGEAGCAGGEEGGNAFVVSGLESGEAWIIGPEGGGEEESERGEKGEGVSKGRHGIILWGKG